TKYATPLNSVAGYLYCAWRLCEFLTAMLLLLGVARRQPSYTLPYCFVSCLNWLNLAYISIDSMFGYESPDIFVPSWLLATVLQAYFCYMLWSFYMFLQQ